MEQSVADFRAHQGEPARLREAVAPALERARRGEGRPLDPERMKEEVTRRLAERGITD